MISRPIPLFLLTCAAAASAAAGSVTVPVAYASGALQKCLGITLDAPKMSPGPNTQIYCRQLPGAALYDQAGVRWGAGDVAGATQLVTRAAEAGNAVAQLRLAVLYEAGQGVTRSNKAANLWYARASAQGEPASQMELGAHFEEADGVAENWDLAFRLYTASARQGWTKGQFELGRAYEFGIGVPQSRAQAIAWFRKAGDQGNAKGRYFADWLRDPTNNRGSRNDLEHDLVIGGKLRFAADLLGADPAGIAFHNSAQRIVWLQGLRHNVDATEAAVMSNIRNAEHEQCMRQHRDNCSY